ncbi:hypothetical protein BMS3Bbin07_01570 [bacterium BMS3Bbin07]|nr:hypothetical protein BMS3Bbin07_01570 [bacterium BMS3Bbin07]
MDRPCKELLAGTALSMQKNRTFCWGNPLDFLNHILDLVTHTYNPWKACSRRNLLFQKKVFPVKPSYFQSPPDNNKQMIYVKRLCYKIIGTLLHRLHSHFYGSICGHYYYRKCGVFSLSRLQHLQTVLLRKFKVSNNNPYGPLLKLLYPLLSVKGYNTFVTL